MLIRKMFADPNLNRTEKELGDDGERKNRV